MVDTLINDVHISRQISQLIKTLATTKQSDLISRKPRSLCVVSFVPLSLLQSLQFHGMLAL